MIAKLERSAKPVKEVIRGLTEKLTEKCVRASNESIADLIAESISCDF